MSDRDAKTPQAEVTRRSMDEHEKPSEEAEPQRHNAPASSAPGSEEDEELSENAASSQMTPLQRRIVVFSLCLVQFLSALDITIVSTALPTITRTLHASASEYAWVGSSYTLASTALTPIWAKMSDVFGKKSMLMSANVCFMTGSLVAALARDPKMLIAGRTLQGVGSGGIQVLITIVIGALFRMEDRAKYYGIVGGVWAVAGALGPVLGGVFTQSLSWRWCFYINLPFGGASLAMLFFTMKIQSPKTPIMEGLRAVDWTGAALIVIGTILFLLGLETGASGGSGWKSAEVICLLVFGVALVAVFLLFEAKFASRPLIPIRIFSSRTNAGSFVVLCVHSFVFIPSDYFLPLYFQVVLHMSPILSGVSMFSQIIPLTLLTGATGFLVKKTGNFVWPIYFGAVVMTLGTGLFIDFGAQREWAKIVVYLLIAGVGVGPVFQTPLIALQAHTAEKDLTAAMSAMTFVRNLFTSMSVVVGSVILQSKLGGGSLSNLHAVQGDLSVYVKALRTMWIFYTSVCAVMIPAALLIKPKDLRRREALEENIE